MFLTREVAYLLGAILGAIILLAGLGKGTRFSWLLKRANKFTKTEMSARQLLIAGGVLVFLVNAGFAFYFAFFS